MIFPLGENEKNAFSKFSNLFLFILRFSSDRGKKKLLSLTAFTRAVCLYIVYLTFCSWINAAIWQIFIIRTSLLAGLVNVCCPDQYVYFFVTFCHRRRGIYGWKPDILPLLCPSYGYFATQRFSKIIRLGLICPSKRRATSIHIFEHSVGTVKDSSQG